MYYKIEYYKIDKDFNVSPCIDLREAGVSKENHPLNLKEVHNGHLVSTVFLPINHGDSDSNPLVFETVVFEGEEIGCGIYLERYSNYEDAKEGHERICEKVKNGHIKNGE